MITWHVSKQRESQEKENGGLIVTADHRFPLSHCEIKQKANAILQSKQGPDYKGVGKWWIFNFLTQHYNVLQPHWSWPLDTQRAKSLNPTAIKSWFDIIKKYTVKLNIRQEDIYGMDESGFPIVCQGKERVIGARGTKTQQKQGGADHENVTTIVMICADGSTLKPMIIFKGNNFKQKWNDNNVTSALWVVCLICKKSLQSLDLINWLAFHTQIMDGLMAPWDINGLCKFSIPKNGRKLAFVLASWSLMGTGHIIQRSSSPMPVRTTSSSSDTLPLHTLFRA